MDSPFLCAKEVAELLGKCTKWVYVNQHQIPGRFEIGKSIFWDREIFFQSLKEKAKRSASQKTKAEPISDKHGLLS